jgi:hypothetical protein
MSDLDEIMYGSETILEHKFCFKDATLTTLKLVRFADGDMGLVETCGTTIVSMFAPGTDELIARATYIQRYEQIKASLVRSIDAARPTDTHAPHYHYASLLSMGPLPKGTWMNYDA